MFYNLCRKDGKLLLYKWENLSFLEYTLLHPCIFNI